jgi:DNA-directed RNA polymerase specialized sigma24 family protein
METATGVAINCAALRARHARKGNGTATNQKRKPPPMKAKSSRFDSLVARYYPAVYSFASRLTDDPWEAVVLTRDAFKSTRKQLRNRRDEVALASILISAVIRAGLTAA